MSTYTAIFPTRSKENLRNCVKSLLKNSRHLDSIIVIWDGSKESFNDLPNFHTSKVHYIQNTGLDVYGMFNYGVKIAETDYVLLVNDDMYFPSDWDSKLPLKRNTVVTFLVVEPGYVPVNGKNITHNFGFTWESFQLEEFEKFGCDFREKGQILNGETGWYMPVVFPWKLFVDAGQYPVEPRFPFPNDIKFFDKLKSTIGVDFLQIMSPVYHFQRLSQRQQSLRQKIWQQRHQVSRMAELLLSH